MMDSEGSVITGDVLVMTTEGRGFTPEEIAERALDRIIYIGSQTHPAIRDQAEAFRENIRQVLVFYMYEAIRSNKVTLVNNFHKAGQSDLIPILDM